MNCTIATSLPFLGFYFYSIGLPYCTVLYCTGDRVCLLTALLETLVSSCIIAFFDVLESSPSSVAGALRVC